MTAPVEVTAACAGCGACLLTCPTHAIRPANTSRPANGGATNVGQSSGHLLVLGSLCTGCLECIEVCPVDAVITTALASSSGATASVPPTAPEEMS